MPKKGHRLQPLPSPLFRPIGPSARPFGLAPWIADDEEAFALDLDGSQNRVCVAAHKALHLSARNATSGAVEIVEGATEQSVFSGSEEFFVPEPIWV